MGRYAPQRGDIIWLSFDDVLGHEQGGRRPALVLSSGAYNRRTGLAVVCLITSRVKGYPFEVVIPEGSKARGAVLCDQIQSVAWRERRAKLLCPAPDGVLVEAVARVRALIEDAA